MEMMKKKIMELKNPKVIEEMLGVEEESRSERNLEVEEESQRVKKENQEVKEQESQVLKRNLKVKEENQVENK